MKRPTLIFLKDFTMPNKLSIKRFLYLGISLITFGLILGGCANTSIATPIPEAAPIYFHRWFALVIAIILGLVQLSVLESEAWFEETFVSSIIGIPLLWSKIGEWTFQLLNWVFNLWNPLIAIAGFLSGLTGNISLALCWIILFGFIFPSSPLFYWAVIPTLLGIAVNIVLILLIKSSKS